MDVPTTPRLPGWSGGTATGAWHRQALDVAEGTEVIGRFSDGTPALTYNRHGLGGAWLAGTHLDIGVKRHGDPASSRLLAAIAQAATGEPLFSADVANDGLPRTWARLRRSGGEGVLSLTTTAPEGGTVTVNVSAERARDLLTGESIEVSSAHLTAAVPPMGARLIHLEGLDG